MCNYVSWHESLNQRWKPPWNQMVRLSLSQPNYTSDLHTHATELCHAPQRFNKGHCSPISQVNKSQSKMRCFLALKQRASLRRELPLKMKTNNEAGRALMETLRAKPDWNPKHYPLSEDGARQREGVWTEANCCVYCRGSSTEREHWPLMDLLQPWLRSTGWKGLCVKAIHKRTSTFTPRQMHRNISLLSSSENIWSCLMYWVVLHSKLKSISHCRLSHPALHTMLSAMIV